MFYGNWITQQAVTNACGVSASTGTPTCLVGDNEESGAVKLGFNIVTFTGTHTAFLAWVQTQLAVGHPVVSGWMVKGDTDSEYDHIMPITGCQVGARCACACVCHHCAYVYSLCVCVLMCACPARGSCLSACVACLCACARASSLLCTCVCVCSRVYSGTATQLTFNDLYVDTPMLAPVPADVLTRAQCNSGSYAYCVPGGTVTDYAFSVTGVVDPLHELFPVWLDVGSWSEPDDGTEDKYYRTPSTLTPTATVSGLTVGQAYALLRFDSAASLPAAGHFLASATWSERVNFTATSTVMVLSGLASFLSDTTMFYRAVAA